MSIAQAYTPNLTLLSKSGVTLSVFHPEAEVTDSLLYPIALETSFVKNPFSYYISEYQGFRLLHLKSGSLHFTVFPSKQAALLSEQGIYLLDSRFPCRIILRDMAEYDILHFSGQSLSYFYRCLPKNMLFWQISPAVYRSGEYLSLFERKEYNPILCHMLLTKMISQLTLEYTLPEKRIPTYLADMKSQMEIHYCQSYALADLEQKYHVNRYRLCREFKIYYQVSPMQYLHKIRIQAAKSLLTETVLKVHEISYEVGYENVNHFITHFKKHTGMTPTEYRQQRLPFPAML